MKQQKDVKFIIYQVLYIFVIVVLTMKGADVDLSKVLKASDVIPKENAVPKEEADRLRKQLDSLLALGLTVELTPINKETGETYPPVKGGFYSSDNFTSNNPDPVKVETDETPKVEPTKDILLDIVKPVQFMVNTIENRNNEPLTVFADGKPITTISPNSRGSYTLMNEKTITFKCGNTERSTGTKANEMHSLALQPVKAGNEDMKLRELQSTVGWRLKINDDFPDQIEVKFRGPVKVESKGNGVYDITLSLCSNKEQFDRMFETKNAPYSVSFDITATDKLSAKSITQQRSFQFGEW
jgi:hypothetical protein